MPRASRQRPVQDERPPKRLRTEPAVVEPQVKVPPQAPSVERPPNREVVPPDQKPNDEPPPKRKRGRPRLSSPRRPVPKPDASSDNVLIKRKSLAVQNQPRDSNGRFGKKGLSNGRFARKKFARLAANAALSRAQRAIERGKVKSWLERRMEETTQLRKRLRSEGEEGVPSGDFMDSEPTVLRRPSLSVAPFKGIGLFKSPNPLSFARRTWISPSEVPDVDDAVAPSDRLNDPATTSGEESEPPVTPDDPYPSSLVAGVSGTAARKRLHIEIEDGESSVGSLPHITAYPVGTLTLNRSPFSFARRRWASLSVSPENKSNQRPQSSPAGDGVSRQDELPTSHPEPDDPLFRFPTVTFSPKRWSVDYDSSSGEEVRLALFSSRIALILPFKDVILPDSPDPSIFVLQRRASFGASLVPDSISPDAQREKTDAPETSAAPVPADSPVKTTTHNVKCSSHSPGRPSPEQPRSKLALGWSLADAGWDSDCSVDSQESGIQSVPRTA